MPLWGRNGRTAGAESAERAGLNYTAGDIFIPRLAAYTTTAGISPVEVAARRLLRDAIARLPWETDELDAADWSPWHSLRAVLAWMAATAAAGRTPAIEVTARTSDGRVAAARPCLATPMYAASSAGATFAGWSVNGGSSIAARGSVAVLTGLDTAASGGPDSDHGAAIRRTRTALDLIQAGIRDVAGNARTVWWQRRPPRLLGDASRSIDPAVTPDSAQIAHEFEQSVLGQRMATGALFRPQPNDVASVERHGGSDSATLEELTRAEVRLVAQLYGVPEAMLGQAAPGADVAAAERAFERTTVAGWAERLIEEWRDVLAPDELALGPTPGSHGPETAQTVEALRREHVISIDEARAMLGLPALGRPETSDPLASSSSDGGGDPATREGAPDDDAADA